jgi:hypothetical protein
MGKPWRKRVAIPQYRRRQCRPPELHTSSSIDAQRQESKHRGYGAGEAWWRVLTDQRASFHSTSGTRF